MKILRADTEIPALRSSLELLSHSPTETCHIGRVLGEGLVGGDCVALTGELGAGKTCMTQGIARGIGVPDSYAITSPTFTLINEYPAKDVALYHVDVYRLQGSADLCETGFDEYLQRGGIMVIEWAEKISDVIPEDAVFITVSYAGDDTRNIVISGCTHRIDYWNRTLRKGGK